MAKPLGDPSVLKLLGSNIARARGERVQAEIAKASGIDVSTISDLENGQRNPSVGTIAALAKVLGVEIADLFRSPQHIVDSQEALEARVAALEKAFLKQRPAGPKKPAPKRKR